MRTHSNGRCYVALGALVVGLTACAQETSSPRPQGDVDEVASVAEELGEAVGGCSTGASGFTAGTTFVLNVTFTGTVVITAPGGFLKMNGQACTTGADGTGTALKVTGTGTNVVKKIVMADTGSGTNQVLLDLYQGSLDTVFAGTAGTGLQVTFTNGGTNSFLIRGGTWIDKINMGKVAANDLHFDIANSTGVPDGKADVKVIEATKVKLSLGDGNDVFAPVTTGITQFSGTTIALSTSAPAVPLTIYGGAGVDTITDGVGADVIYGGAGADVIKSTYGGNDSLYGGTEVDMLDFGARLAAAAVNVNLRNQGTLTFADVPADGNTVTIDTQAYTFKTALSESPAVPFEVLIGGTPAATIANLVAAINGAAGEGSTYGTGTTAHTTATAVAASSTTMVATAKESGVAAASIATTEVGPNTSWGAVTLAAGSGTIGAEVDSVYEFENVTGGAGNDSVAGNEVANLVYGGTGDDVVNAGTGLDTVYGGAGNDSISGGAGDVVDNLYGELGDDVFVAESTADGIDVIVGGGGFDTVTYAARTTAVTATLGATADDNLNADIHGLIGGSAGDTLTGSALADTITGGAGSDTILGMAGGDYIVGSAGDDDIQGGDGDDVLLGEEDVDSIQGGLGDDAISGGAGADTLLGNEGNDQILGGAGNDTITGGTGADVMNGNAGTNTMTGGGEAGDTCVTIEGTNDVPSGCDVF